MKSRDVTLLGSHRYFFIYFGVIYTLFESDQLYLAIKRYYIQIGSPYTNCIILKHAMWPYWGHISRSHIWNYIYSNIFTLLSVFGYKMLVYMDTASVYLLKLRKKVRCDPTGVYISVFYISFFYFLINTSIIFLMNVIPDFT